jgi:hypothetical protein
MKNRITFLFLQGLAAGVVAILAQTAQGQVIYNNTGNFGGGSQQEGNYSFGNNGNEQVGNEIVIGNGFGTYEITSFAVQFFLSGTTLSGNEQVTLSFYYNTGATGPSGQPAPFATPFWTSGPSTLSAFTGASGQTLTYTPDVTPITPDFTWTLTFSGINDGVTGETAGLSIFNNNNNVVNGIPVPTTGGNYNDAWVNNGGTWSLNQANSGDPGLQFGAVAQTGTPLPVPEPSTIALGVLGACGFLARRRKS